MNTEKMILISNLLIFIGVTLGGIGTFGKFYFETKLKEEGKIEVKPLLQSDKFNQSSPTSMVDYNIVSTGSGLFEIHNAYIEVLSFEIFHEEPMQSHGAHGIGRIMDGRDTSILLEINQTDKFYQIPLFIFNKEKVSSAIFENNDFSVLQIHYSFEPRSRIRLRLVIEGNNIKDSSKFKITSPEVTLEDHQFSKGKWVTPYGAMSNKDNSLIYSKKFYEILTSSTENFDAGLKRLINASLNDDFFSDLNTCVNRSSVHYSTYSGPTPGVYLQRCLSIAMSIDDSRTIKSLLLYLRKVPMDDNERSVISKRINEIEKREKQPVPPKLQHNS